MCPPSYRSDCHIESSMRPGGEALAGRCERVDSADDGAALPFNGPGIANGRISQQHGVVACSCGRSMRPFNSGWRRRSGGGSCTRRFRDPALRQEIEGGQRQGTSCCGQGARAGADTTSRCGAPRKTDVATLRMALMTADANEALRSERRSALMAPARLAMTRLRRTSSIARSRITVKVSSRAFTPGRGASQGVKKAFDEGWLDVLVPVLPYVRRPRTSRSTWYQAGQGLGQQGPAVLGTVPVDGHGTFRTDGKAGADNECSTAPSPPG